MLALVSVWTGLVCLLLAVAMVVHRPLFNDISLVVVLYFGVPGTLCLAGLVLWAHRKSKIRRGGDRDDEPGLAMRRVQCKVAIGLALTAAAIIYALVILAQPVPTH